MTIPLPRCTKPTDPDRAAVPSHRVGDASLETAEPCPTAYDHGVTCPCPACSAQTAAMRDVARLTHLADHGSTTEQINARAELMRLGLRRRPGLTEEQAYTQAVDCLAPFASDGEKEAVQRALLRASRGELGPTKPGAQ